MADFYSVLLPPSIGLQLIIKIYSPRVESKVSCKMGEIHKMSVMELYALKFGKKRYLVFVGGEAVLNTRESLAYR